MIRLCSLTAATHYLLLLFNFILPFKNQNAYLIPGPLYVRKSGNKIESRFLFLIPTGTLWKGKILGLSFFFIALCMKTIFSLTKPPYLVSTFKKIWNRKSGLLWFGCGFCLEKLLLPERRSNNLYSPSKHIEHIPMSALLSCFLYLR